MKPLQYWNPNGFEISSYRFSLNDRRNKFHKTSGSDNSELCLYTYNELGFRGDSIHKEGFKVMSLGCSITEGVGVNDHETWPSQFCSHIQNSVNMNFGTGGRSNDFIVRCLLSYYDLIKPNLVLINYTFPTRREVYTSNNEIEPYIPFKSWGRLAETEEGKEIQKSLDFLHNENADFINWYKNHLIIRLFLQSKNCNWVWNGINLGFDYYEPNRFDGEKNWVIDKGSDGLHPGPLTHKKYAKLLFDYISMKFPDFIKSNTNYEMKII